MNEKNLSVVKSYFPLVVVFMVLFSGSALGHDLSTDMVERQAPPTVAYTTGTPVEFSEASPTAQTPAGKEQSVPSIGTYARDFFPDLWYGTKRIFTSDNIPLAAIGFGTAALAVTVDHKVSDYFKRNTPLSESAVNAGDTLGSGYVEVGAGLALLGTGELINDKRMADAGVVSLEAVLIDGVFTETLKYIVQRPRPNGGDNMSFPSGHASVTAAFSASVSEMYDWNLWIAVPLYLTTAWVGVSRIQAQEHYLSDVIAGITLGTLVGSSVAKYHKEKGGQTGILYNITILPVYDQDFRGCAIMLRY